MPDVFGLLAKADFAQPKPTETPSAYYYDPSDDDTYNKQMEAIKSEGSLKEIPEEHLSFTDAFTLGRNTSVLSVWSQREELGTNDSSNYYMPTKGEHIELQKLTNYNDDLIDTLLSGAKSYGDVKKNLELVKQTQQDDQKIQSAGIMANIGGALGNMSGNPVDIASLFVPNAVFSKGIAGLAALGMNRGLATFGTHLAFNVGAGVGANVYSEQETGIDANPLGDVLAITAMSLGLRGAGVLKDAGVDITGNLAKLQQGDYVSGWSGKIANLALPSVKKMNDIRVQMDSWLPNVEVKSNLLKAMGRTQVGGLKDFIGKMTNYEQGIRELDGKQVATKKATFVENTKGMQVIDRRVMDDVRVDVSDLTKSAGGDREVVNEYLLRKMRGESTQHLDGLLDTKLGDAVADRLGKALEERGKLLIDNIIIGSAYRFGKYIPVVIDRYKMAEVRMRYGSETAFRQRMVQNMVEGVTTSAEHSGYFKQIYKEEMAELAKEQAKIQKANSVKGKRGRKKNVPETPTYDDWLKKKANDSSWGYIDQNTSRSGIDVGTSDQGSAMAFTKHRLPWNTAYKSVDDFSIDSVRGDIVDSLDRYFKRSSGEIAAIKTYGMGYNDLMKHIDDLTMQDSIARGRPVGEREALAEQMKGLIRRGYGMAVNDAEYGTADALSAIARNLTYGAYSTLMGVLNYGEMAGALRAYGASFLFKSLPVANEIYRRLSGKTLSIEDSRYIKNFFTGQEVVKRLGVNEIMRSTSKLYKGVPKYLQKVVGISKVLSDYSPGSYVMNYSNQSIMDTVQNTFWSELVIKAHSGAASHQKGARAASEATFGKRGFLRDVDLKRNNISKHDYRDFMRELRNHTTMDADGHISLNDNFSDLMDKPRFANTIRRLTDYVSNETIQRRGFDDMFVWQVGKGHPMLGLALQFKSFALQSYNKRFVKLMNRMEDEGVLASMNEFAIGGALSAAVTIAQLQLRSAGMEEDKRKEYLQKVLGFSGADDFTTEGGIQALLTAGSRHPVLASMSLIANSVGIGTKAKTTAGTNISDEDDESGFITARKLGDTIIDMSPALRFTNDVKRGLIGAANIAQDGLTDSFTGYERKQAYKQLGAMFGVIPNIPYASNRARRAFEDWGEEYKSK